MPRKLSESTLIVYRALWNLPWACAADIVRFTGHVKDLKAPAVKNILARGEKRGWLVSARLGRADDAVDRYVFTNAGVEEFEAAEGLRHYWWHTADGVTSLARRLEVVEMAYTYLPPLFQSNLVTDPKVWVFRETPGTAAGTGEPVSRVSLQEADWSESRLVRLYWLQEGPFEAVAIYANGTDFLYLPLLWRGDFQKSGGISSVRRDMAKLFVRNRRWNRLPMDQAVNGPYYPGMVVFCPNRVTAAVLQRHWIESVTRRDDRAVPAIVDAQGQVIRSMTPPTSWWENYPRPAPGGDLKDISRAVERLGTGPYASVNGRRSWRAFRCVDGAPGITSTQIAASLGVSPTVERALLEPMLRSKVFEVLEQGSHYLDVSGRGLLAYSQRVTPARVVKRFGVYANKDGRYRRRQRSHNHGLAESILQLCRHGFAAFPALGLYIDYWEQGRRIRAAPDGFVILPPGVVVAIEYERSAEKPDDVMAKARVYQRLTDIGFPLVVLFITETAEAAGNLRHLRQDYLLATTLEAVKQGPHGHSVLKDGKDDGSKSGCWWYWYPDMDAPSVKAPIDLWDHRYAQSTDNVIWRLPLDRPFRAFRTG